MDFLKLFIVLTIYMYHFYFEVFAAKFQKIDYPWGTKKTFFV